MQRRSALQYLPIAFAISASVDQLIGLARRVNTGRFSPENERERLIVALADTILPTTTTPSASEAGVPAFIQLFMEELASPDAREKFYVAVDTFASACERQYGVAFQLLPPSAQTVYYGAMLQKLDEFCVQFKRLTMTGYFTSQAGMTQALNYLPIPGSFNACVQMTAETKSEASYF